MIHEKVNVSQRCVGTRENQGFDVLLLSAPHVHHTSNGCSIFRSNSFLFRQQRCFVAIPTSRITKNTPPGLKIYSKSSLLNDFESIFSAEIIVSNLRALVVPSSGFPRILFA